MTPSGDASIKRITICEHCGSKVDDKVPFCPSCGYPLPDIAELAEIAEPRRREEPRKSAGGGVSSWWWLMLMGLFAGCVLLGVLGAGLLGVYDGLQERSSSNRQTAEEHYRRGLAYMNSKEYDLAVAEFDLTLRLDPSQADAAQKLQEAEAMSRLMPTPTSATQNEVLRTVFAGAQNLYSQGHWEETITKLEQVRSLDSSYQASQVQDMLYGSYYNLGLQLVEEGRVEEALTSFDKALVILPNRQEAQEQKKLASLYVQAKKSWGEDLAGTVETLKELYELSPDYQNVATLLPDAYSRYGDSLADKEEWCLAQQQYEAVLQFRTDLTEEAKLDDASARCGTPSARPATATPRSKAATPSPTAPKTRTAISPTATAAVTVTVKATTEITAPPRPVTGTPPALAATTPTVTETPQSSAAALTGKIYYSVGGRVEVVPAEGGTSQPILYSAAQPAIDPAGQRIAYKTLAGESIGIHVSDASGGGDSRFTLFAEDSYPSWSPDGGKLVIASNREGDRLWRVYMADAGVQESPSLGLGTYPAWSPKGNPVAYHGCNAQGDDCGLYTVDTSAANRGRLTLDGSDTAPAWSPDGSRLAFMSSGDGNWEIYLIGADGSGRKRLTENAANDLLPAWSPDGRYVAFASNRDGIWAIYAVSADGGEARKVTDIGTAWSWPDEKLSWGK